MHPMLHPSWASSNNASLLVAVRQKPTLPIIPLKKFRKMHPAGGTKFRSDTRSQSVSRQYRQPISLQPAPMAIAGFRRRFHRLRLQTTSLAQALSFPQAELIR